MKWTIARFNVYSYSTRPEPLETHTTLNTRFLTGSCTFPNQNGSCHITLPNLQYSDGNRYYKTLARRGDDSDREIVKTNCKR